MNQGNVIVALLGSVMALMLAWRALRSRRLAPERMIWMGVIWTIIIISVAFFARRLLP